MQAPRLLITIDAEEDEWGKFDLPRYGVSNIGRIPLLQRLFEQNGFVPTYVITAPVAEDPVAIEVLAPIVARGACEIGVHCHPWNTPPFVEERTPRNSMLCNLPSGLQVEKLGNLIGSISANYGVTPRSFRAGRWGFSAEVGRNLTSVGIIVDSSITPYVSWAAQHGPDFDRSYPETYRVSGEDLTVVDPASDLVEVPVTIGFTGVLRAAGYPVHRALRTSPLRALRGRGILNRVGLFRTSWLCPELAGSDDMIALTEAQVARGASILNFMFHSGALLAGKTPYVRTPSDEVRFLRRIETYLRHCRARGFGSVTLSEIGAEALGDGVFAPSLA